jgi:hypothetical protein
MEERVQLEDLRRQLTKSSELYHFDLLKPSRLQDFVTRRGINLAGRDTVINLWRSGLLRADVVVSRTELNDPSFKLISSNGDERIYCDERPVQHRIDGYGGIFSKESHLPDVDLHFHPFRLFALYHIVRVFKLNVCSTQYLLNPEGFQRLFEFERSQLDQWTSSQACADRFEYWNRVCEYAIALEPSSYAKVYHSTTWRYPDSEQTIRDKRKHYHDIVRLFLQQTPASEIKQVRSDLCCDAQILDDNKLIHVLLRLMSAHERLKLKSTLGAATLLVDMAEIIRRAAEDATGTLMPEEDEIGFGQWMDGARRTIYGSDRLLDSSPATKRDFLTSMGLDFGVKVRCYLEGDTELGALTSAISDGHGIEFINLRAKFVEKGGKGLSFADSLKNDRKAKIFSVVVLDGDRKDNIKVVKAAAKSGDFFGRFFVASPDIEFENFRLDELVEIASSILARRNNLQFDKQKIEATVAGATTGKEFFKLLAGANIKELEKSTEWGIAMMDFALKNPRHPRIVDKDAVRQIVEIAKLLLIGRQSGYQRSFDKYRVDANTGQLVAR